MLSYKAYISRLSTLIVHSRKPTLRNFSANAVEDYTNSLIQRQPSFNVLPTNVEVLSAPHQFYSTLLDMVKRARRQIFLSSLYIGHEDTELIDTLHTALASNASLRLQIHLDLNRSTRPGPMSPARAIIRLVHDYPDRVNIHLFRSPKLKGMMASMVPSRFNEGWGTWHPKIYGVDDDVMISGANLNTSYFTNRQDRYLRLKSHPELAHYCQEFLQKCATFSYRLLPSKSSTFYDLHWPDPHTHPHYIESKAGRVLTELQNSWSKKRAFTPPNPGEVLLFPIIQAGQFNVREEEQCIALLFKHLSTIPHSSSSTPMIHLTSGYFGLYKPYQDLILKSNARCQIICASPKANGFYNARDISGRIPEAYTLLEQRFMAAVQSAGRSGVTLSQWEKEGWTYHAKGLWVSPTPASPPVLTLFGSTNLNSRSSNLDTELSFIMATPLNADSATLALQTLLQKEIDSLAASVVPWGGASGLVRLGTRLLVGLGVGEML